ncbi:hypothetical protein PVAP13_5KG208407 [Panicum virgatum]|uniref:PROP1-like PPR domain-containing protein n=1 Tax=Panicum virgatum TaxID=38727 RepID=A0A8T0SCG1_PANVG|nr:hypothetical protein PVAP13_5KG208407 [Panicum virgatum]
MLLEWVEQSKLFEFGERDYASCVDLMAKGEIVYRTLLANCVHESNVNKAEQVFNKMKDLGLPITVFSFNQLKIADVLAMMEKENVKPSLFSYKLLIDAKGSARDIEGMEKVVEQMETEGIEPDLMFQATIARHYIFDGQREKAGAFGILLPLYGFLGKNHDECLSAIEAFGRLGNVEKAEKVFEDMFVRWKTLSSKYYNAMLRMYANQNLLDKGKELLKRMDENNVKFGNTTLDSLVKLYVDAGEVEKAESLLHKLSLKNRIRPQYTTYLMLLDSYSKKGDIHNSERVFNRLRQIGYSGRVKQYQFAAPGISKCKGPSLWVQREDEG